MSLQDHDKSALHRELLRDLEALIAVNMYLRFEDPRRQLVDAEIEALVKELWGG